MSKKLETTAFKNRYHSAATSLVRKIHELNVIIRSCACACVCMVAIALISARSCAPDNKNYLPASVRDVPIVAHTYGSYSNRRTTGLSLELLLRRILTTSLPFKLQTIRWYPCGTSIFRHYMAFFAINGLKKNIVWPATDSGETTTILRFLWPTFTLFDAISKDDSGID